MKREFSASVWREGEVFIAQCREVEIARQGATEDKALAMLRESLGLHFTPPLATALPDVRKLQVEIPAA